MGELKFSFLSRWKEELVCSSERGSFVLVFAMGKPTVYLPSEQRWAKLGPAWAKGEWPNLRDQLQAWCDRGSVDLVVDDESSLYELQATNS